MVSGERAPLTGRAVVLVTNRVDWSAATIIGRSWQRWPTETFAQDRKGHSGFNEDRLRSAEALGQHWCLVVVASALVQLTCLPTGADRTRGLIQTIGDACQQQGRALLQHLSVFVHDQLSRGATIDHVLGGGTPLLALRFLQLSGDKRRFLVAKAQVLE